MEGKYLMMWMIRQERIKSVDDDDADADGGEGDGEGGDGYGYGYIGAEGGFEGDGGLMGPSGELK